MTLQEILSANRNQIIAALPVANLKQLMIDYVVFVKEIDENENSWEESFINAPTVHSLKTRIAKSLSEFNYTRPKTDGEAKAAWGKKITDEDNRNAAAMASTFGYKAKKYTY